MHRMRLLANEAMQADADAGAGRGREGAAPTQRETDGRSEKGDLI